MTHKRDKPNRNPECISAVLSFILSTGRKRLHLARSTAENLHDIDSLDQRIGHRVNTVTGFDEIDDWFQVGHMKQGAGM